MTCRNSFVAQWKIPAVMDDGRARVFRVMRNLRARAADRSADVEITSEYPPAAQAQLSLLLSFAAEIK